MKLLFISLRDVNRKNSGGEKCTNRNYLSFCEILGKENVDVINIANYTDSGFISANLRRFSVLRGFYAGFSKNILRTIILKSKDYDIVYIDVSYLGMISKNLRKSHYKGRIISFFHNVESDVMKQKARINFLEYWKIYPVKYNEKQACKYSDRIIALTKRDADKLKEIYGAKSVGVIPISLPDELKHSVQENTNVPPQLLFIGDNWYPNIQGLKWFIENVLDHVNVKLRIVGRNLDKYKNAFSHPMIEFLGFVEDLSSVIIEADYILCPIFSGGGMKVKVCEALMYGKNIIASSEAFEGYDLKYDETGLLCNTREEFISGIEKYAQVPRKRFNLKSREYYLNEYSFQATLPEFRKLLDSLQSVQ